MNRLVMLALAGVMTLALGACGESTPPKPETTSSEVAVENAPDAQQDQTAAPAVSADEAPASTDEAPASTDEAPAAE